MRNLLYILLGIAFGIVMYKSETASWFRIYEMFHFQSFHMYGFIGGALVVGALGIQWIKRSQKKDIDGKTIVIPPKEKSVMRYLIGGIFFGLGWALVGACPGPLFVLFGAGVWSILIAIIGALLGTYLYGVFKNKLPH
ncbi:YeeE/YedE family protein [Capnocytophaga canimorsus]|uniref:YeeE/YedE family protein n=1 Tax=Capnocytophaga canimorsus TaxID=28188 RepID=UPI00385A18E1